MKQTKLLERLETTLKLEITSYKERQLVRRVGQFLKRKGYSCEREFLADLEANGELKAEFLDNFTINTSQFFRDDSVFKVIQSDVLPELLEENGSLRVWSAGASIGAEIYSIAILLKELGRLPLSSHHLLATDIDRDILKVAARGKYKADKVKNLPGKLLRKYFTKKKDKRTDAVRYALAPEIKGAVRFKAHDLLKDRYPRSFDLILCRNVLIYMQRPAQEKIIKNLLSSLNSDGYLLLGASEVVFGTLQENLERKGPSVYKHTH